jgi:hypothetical protein
MYNDKLIETMKEKILEAFAELGFQLEQMDDFGYGFSYEGTNFIFMPNSDDEEFLNICVPGIYDLEEESPLSFIELMNKINSTLKYIKAYELGKSIWLFYERELFGDEDLAKVISRMILHLEAGLMFSRKAMTEIKSNEEDKGEDNDIVESDDKE